MKLYFAAAAVALLASPAFAASVISEGQTAAQDCAIAAGKSGAPLSDRQFNRGMTACNAALAGELSLKAQAGTLVNRGLLLVSAGDTSAAIADFSAGIERDPSLAAAYLNRGNALMRARRYSEARADFDRAISLKVADAHVAYFNRGGAQEELGNTVAAYRDYLKAQELAPGFAPARLELARFQVNARVAAR
jgi:tetratricopeptide (TPR) repeat protein